MESVGMRELSQRRLAEIVKNNRQSNGWSQDQLSEKTGIHRTMIGRIERMDYLPTIPQLESLAESLDFEIESLFDESKPRIRTAYRGKNLSPQEKAGTDRLLEMMMAAKQQIALRKALHNE